MGRRVRRVGVGILGVGLFALVLVAAATISVRLPGEKMTPAGIRRSSSSYVKMRES
jgi:hypothetical protein